VSRLSSREIDVWNAVYAAEWVASFRAAEAHGVDFDRATGADGKPDTLSHAERAITVADRAIMDLRRWRKSECPDAGEVVRP